MTAKKGWSGSVRHALGICLALALLGSAIMASAAAAKKNPAPPSNYVALGDSLSYGYSQQKFEENYPTESPTAFEGGFVNLLAKKLAKLEARAAEPHTLVTANLSCPGEVSDGLIGENPALGGGQEGNGKSDSAPCAWHNVDGFPRHFEYGSISQLEAAIGIVQGAFGPLGTTKWVTLQIGSNDELAVVGACENESYRTAHGFTGVGLAGLKECLGYEASESGTYFEKGLFYHIIHNLGDVVGVLRHEGLTGEVGILGFYNPQAEILPGSDELQQSLNAHLEGAINAEAFGPGVVYADPFSKINPANGKKESKAICKYTEECNKHDKHVNFVKYLEKEDHLTHEQAEGYATQKESEGYVFPEGDIHPTPAGHKLFAGLLYEALTTGKNSGGDA